MLKNSFWWVLSLVVFVSTANAQLPDFTEMVRDNGDAVVNISTTQKVDDRGGDFNSRQMPEDIPTATVGNKSKLLIKLLVDVELVESNAQAKRLIRQGGVSVDGQRVSDPNMSLEPADGMVLQIGRRKFLKLELKN